jgi:predicted GTPase
MNDFAVEAVKCNMLLIGKTGTGKSSFANYLFGVDKFTTGTGAPVTKWEENFQQYDLNVSDVQINVYDSVGLEPNNFEKWMRELDSFLSERQVIKRSGFLINRCAILSANDIMHVLFYTINGAGGRIEASELSTLDKIYQDYKIPISIIITNCDVASESQISAIEKEAKSKCFETVRVCSVSRKTRGGDKKEQFGKESALKNLLSASYEKVGRELTIIVLKKAIEFLEKTESDFVKKIDDSDISIFKADGIDSEFDDISGWLDGINMDVEDVLPPAYISYHEFIENFNIEYQGRDVFERTFEDISSLFENFNTDNISLIRKINKAAEDMDYGNVLEKIRGFFAAAEIALRMKSKIKEAVHEIFNEIVFRLYSQLEKLKSQRYVS